MTLSPPVGAASFTVRSFRLAPVSGFVKGLIGTRTSILDVPSSSRKPSTDFAANPVTRRWLGSALHCCFGVYWAGGGEKGGEIGGDVGDIVGVAQTRGGHVRAIGDTARLGEKPRPGQSGYDTRGRSWRPHLPPPGMRCTTSRISPCPAPSNYEGGGEAATFAITCR